jgi:hypothetical protein
VDLDEFNVLGVVEGIRMGKELLHGNCYEYWLRGKC